MSILYIQYISLYIMKYYDLVFEVGIESWYLSWFLHTVALFRVSLKAPRTVLTVTVGYVLSCILLIVFLSFNTADSFLALFIPLAPYHTVGVPLPSAQPRVFMHLFASFHTFWILRVWILLQKNTNLGCFLLSFSILKNVRLKFKIWILHISKKTKVVIHFFHFLKGL